MTRKQGQGSELAAHGFVWEEGLHLHLTKKELAAIVAAALEEDDTRHDITTAATVLSNRRARCRLVARQSGVIAGLPLATEAFEQLDNAVTIRIDQDDGSRVGASTPVMFLSGHARGLLSAERVALNFVQRLSGIATLTARYVEAVAGTGAHILDTRKTTPGWRRLEKYAVRAGGGTNHRSGLHDAVLVKDNHIRLAGGVARAIVRMRAARQEMPVEIEAQSLEQVDEALAGGAEIILLDNLSIEQTREAVRRIARRARVEISGGVTLERIPELASTGADFVSVGALTHSAPAADLSFEIEPDA